MAKEKHNTKIDLEEAKDEQVMRIYGSGIVWDAKNKKPLCVFNKDGFFDTTDEGIIAALEKTHRHEPATKKDGDAK